MSERTIVPEEDAKLGKFDSKIGRKGKYNGNRKQ
jgi:hypothetical protein